MSYNAPWSNICGTYDVSAWLNQSSFADKHWPVAQRGTAHHFALDGLSVTDEFCYKEGYSRGS
jgi:hypothetical protein